MRLLRLLEVSVSPRHRLISMQYWHKSVAFHLQDSEAILVARHRQKSSAILKVSRNIAKIALIKFEKQSKNLKYFL
jgi:hypothetical protein